MSKPDSRDFEDRYYGCFVDFGLKTVMGALMGAMVGGFFLGKRWPTVFGAALGLGMAYNNCENNLNSYLLSREPKICIIKKKP